MKPIAMMKVNWIFIYLFSIYSNIDSNYLLILISNSELPDLEENKGEEKKAEETPAATTQ